MLYESAMLHSSCNTHNLDNGGLNAAGPKLSGASSMVSPDDEFLDTSAREIRTRLPPGWAVDVVKPAKSRVAGLRFRSSEGRSKTVAVAVCRRIDPRVAERIPPRPGQIVIAPYLSKSVREVLESNGLSYADPTGNLRLILDEPGLFVSTFGATTDPSPQRRQLSLRGVKAGRVVRALAHSLPPVGVRELAELAGTDPGYVSRLVRLLDAEAIVGRTIGGRVERIDLRRLLERWADDAPITTRSTVTTWFAARGLRSVEERLLHADFEYLITGSAAAVRLAPVAATRLLSIYVEAPERAARDLDLRPALVDANVILLQPRDDTIFARALEVDGLRLASMPTIVADLLTGTGRSPAEAEGLMEWIENNESSWRG